MRVGLYAVDAGPRSVFQILERYECFEVIQSENININNFDSIIIGTSCSKQGKKLESRIRQYVIKSKIPLVIIEDYPGNYNHVPNGHPHLLIVEHQSCIKLYKEKLAGACPNMVVISNPRYDDLRIKANLEQESLKKKWENNKEQQHILWAGQPETDDGLQILNEIIPVLRCMNVKLLFKAHPRDLAYQSGVYSNVSAYLGKLWMDVTSFDLQRCIDMYAPNAVLTQYSSLAIEAGFYGIPSAYVLYPDIGAKRIMIDKAYAVPPWCLSGAGMVIQKREDVREALSKLMYDENIRCSINEKFYSWFGRKPTAEKVVSEITFLDDR